MLGDIAPNFTLPDQNGNKFELYNNLDKKVLLVFYPKDESPVCTKQLSEYNVNLKELEKHDIKIVAINTASENSHLSFCNKLNFKFPVLSDVSKEVSKKYKALNLFRFNKRKLVLVDKNRKIVCVNSTSLLNYVKVETILDKAIQ